MLANPFHISIDTLIGVSSILGHRLEDRSAVREAQNSEIVRFVQERSTTPLRNESQQQLFCVAPIDVLVTHHQDRKRFHIIELNGSGIGGLTNISEEAVGCVLDGMFNMAVAMPKENPVIIIASSGLESEQMPRRNKMIYEKILYAEAFRRGFQHKGHRANINTVAQLRDAPWEIRNDNPTIVLGYMKEFLRWLQLTDEGLLQLFGRTIDAGVNDRFCLNVVHQFPDVDLQRFQTMNRCFLPGADKATAYKLINEYLQKNPTPVSQQVLFELAPTREDLIEKVLTWRKKEHRVLIKPQGTGLGHGIEFFLDPQESAEQVIARIDGSLLLTERYYGLQGGALPYTVCEFLETAVIEHNDHPAKGHRYELRVVVYRDGLNLKAFPSIVKISSQVYNPNQPSHLSLINNITASAVATESAGAEHMLPLSSAETLEVLGLRIEELAELSHFCTQVVRYVLDQVEDEPLKLGLPAASLVS
ncbi:MAG: hypothetical protein ACFCD0_25505 [Gemmataceae bacterium]